MIDGILFDDGRLFEVRYDEVTIRGVAGDAARLSGESPYVIEIGPDCSSLVRNASVRDGRTDRDYICGEGSWGGDGFVACHDRAADRLLWIAFFQRSNPFVHIGLENDCVVAENNHGHAWTFEIENPLDFRVT